MVAADDASNYARKLGVQRDQVVQEFGWDEDTDDNIRAAVEEACGSELLDEDTDEVVDVVLLWWRDGDGDLVDTLMDAISPLAEDGVIWVLTPKTGKPGHVLPAEIAEAAPTAGLMPTSSVNLGIGAPAAWCSRSRAPGSVDAAGRHDRSRFHPARPEPAAHHAEQLSRRQERSAGVFPLAFTKICQGELDQLRDQLPRFDNDNSVALAISVGPPPTHKVWAAQSGFTFPVLSDFWPHGQVSQAFGVFNDGAGYPNRGTFVVDRSGIIRFAEMKEPGEARDQQLWTDALEAVRV